MSSSPPTPKPPPPSPTRKIINFLLSQWLSFGFAIACILAHFFPKVASQGGVIRSEYSIVYGAVAFIFFVSGLCFPPSRLAVNITNWRLHVIVQGISFLVFPAVVLAILHICLAAGALQSGTPSIPIIIGMLTTSCIPTTIASNVVVTRLAGGDDAAAIICVILGNVLGAFISPLLIFALMPTSPIFDPWRPASPSTLSTMYRNVAMQLGLAVLLPLAIGQVIRTLWEKPTARVLTALKLNKIASGCLILLVWATFSNAFYTGAIYRLGKPSVVFNVMMNVAIYLLLTLICFFAARPPLWLGKLLNPYLDSPRLPGVVRRVMRVKRMSREQTVAVCFCGAAKTTSLGIPLVTAMWKETDSLTRAYIQIPVLLYTIEQVFLAQLLVYFFRYYLARDGKTDGEMRSDTDEQTERSQGDVVENISVLTNQTEKL